MQFANVNGVKSHPAPSLKGICYCCGSEVISKCGNFKIWHWAHKNLKHCDIWWESETDWHRKWKNQFPIENQEIIHFDNKTGEKHIADVKTNNGVIIEFQNSPMSIEELKSRELFYGNMIWIVNGRNFIKNLHIYDKLPDPDSKVFKEYIFRRRSKNSAGAFFEKPVNLDGKIVYCLSSIKEIEYEIQKNYKGHHLYHWSNPRNVWFQTTKKVFIDRGDESLYELTSYRQMIPCIRKWDKNEFIERALNPKK